MEVKTIAATSSHVYALTSDGTVWQWQESVEAWINLEPIPELEPHPPESQDR